MDRLLLSCLFVLSSIQLFIAQSFPDVRFKVVTVATEETDGYKRFIRSAHKYGLEVEVHGLHEKWLGGDMENGPGGGHKINILRRALKKYKDQKDLILMFTDSYDVVFNGDKQAILERFLERNVNILISAEDFCWPDKSLAVKYPKVPKGYKYLCSGGIIGYANKIYEILNYKPVKHTDDDQLYYTEIYLQHRLNEQVLRGSLFSFLWKAAPTYITKQQKDDYKIQLDNEALLFQNLHGNEDDVEIAFDGDVRLWNKRFNTYPVVIHGNGPSKLYLDHLGNYLANAWTYQDGCKECNENTYKLDDINTDDWSRILIGLYIPVPTPFVESYLQHIANLDYPKSKIDVFLHSIEPHHNPAVDTWLAKYKDEYRSITYKSPRAFLTDMEGRNAGLAHCRKVRCDYYFNVDSLVTLTNRNTLKSLLQQNRTFITPMISKVGKLFSNFWGKISSDGFYARSPDYIDIVKSVRRGVWNVPFVSNVYLISAATIDKMADNPFYSDRVDQDMAFSDNNRRRGIFMYVTNREHFGHIKEHDTYTTNYKHNDLYQMFDNRKDWEERYIHPEYREFLKLDSTPQQPCPDVYWFPMVTANFTRELIEVMEHFGDWSGGRNKDERIAGGYENVPTVDIHMNQVGLEKHWLQMLKDYVAPMCTRYFTGYHPHSHAIMNFVVKYSTNGQYFLRPHHDASTFTINMALNDDTEYEGGGVRFTRYNCSLSKTKNGWALMHPGRLTHQHEGLPITKGLRYIMVSFIDP